MWNSIVTDHWEGLMLRKNCLWEGKRSNNLLKVKRMKDDEFRVVGIETGQIRFIDKGRENEKQTMSSIIVDYNNTKVGSGFTMEERDAYYKNPSLILDQNVTVQYFEKTKEKLRFPVYKGIRNEMM
jgi:ATP-dependent DNA ligase